METGKIGSKILKIITQTNRTNLYFMNRIHILCILCLFSLLVKAQNNDGLFFKDQALIEQIAEHYAKNGSDDGQKASFKQAILEAFDNYWKNKKAKSSLKISEIQNYSEKRSDLESKIATAEDSIAKLRKTMEEEDSKLLMSQLEKGKKDASLADSLLKTKKLELESCQNELKKQQTLIADSKKSGNNLQAILASVEQDIENAFLQVNGKLCETDVELMNQAVSGFQENIDDFKEIFEPKQYDELTSKYEKIRKILPLCIAIHNAIVQMGENRYDEHNNNKIRKEIVGELNNAGKAHEKEINEVITALDNQNSAFTNINWIINNFKKYNDLGNIDVEGTIEMNLSFLDDNLVVNNRGQKSYNKYYKVFNNALDSIRRKVPSIKTNDQLGKFLDKLINEL